MTDIKRDMLIDIDWIQKTGVSVKKKRIKFNMIENKVPE